MSHRYEYCRTPRSFMRKIGAVYACDCGQMWRLVKHPTYLVGGHSTKGWVKFYPITKPERTKVA